MKLNVLEPQFLPYYVILSPEDEIISTFPGMTRKLNEFIDFLDAGLEG